MKNVMKNLLIGILFFIILIHPWGYAYGATESTDTVDTKDTPDTKDAEDTDFINMDNTENKNLVKEIRVGLFFNEQSRNLNTSVAYFDIFAEKGLDIGYNDGKEFTSLISINDNTVVTVLKDSYFVMKDKGLLEYDPDRENIPDGKKVGPFHVKIADNYKDYNHARTEANKIREKGISAYPVYNNGSWCIWTGFYPNEKSAIEDIDEIISKKLGNGDYAIITPNPNNIVVTSDFDEVLAIFSEDDGNLRIHPNNENDPYIFNINGKNYRGVVEVNRLEYSDMTVINVLPLEHYLYGVVPCEIGWEVHSEAIKAQAVVARTYTYSNLGKYSKVGFDLCSTVNSQVYKGFDFEKEATNKAVDDTVGKVIYYDSTIAQVFYFSSSGGRTEAVKNVWSSDIPYLQSVKDEYESGNSYNYNWEKSLTVANINNIITSRGNTIGNILGINISKTSEAGRAIEVIILGSKGDVILEKARCRDVLGLPSQWYNITTNADISVWDNSKKSIIKMQPSGRKVITNEGIKTVNLDTKVFLMASEDTAIEITGAPTTYTFRGKGYGHAVGMSQAGAKGMAEAGFTFEEILSHYFVGTYIE